jgi:hypothetical protein
MDDLSRRKFLLASGVAATGAAAATPTLMGALAKQAGRSPTGDPAGVVVTPTQPAPPEPVMAYVRDAGSGELTVMSGTLETTYRDPALVRRLLKAAPAGEAVSEGGDSNVIAS